MRLMQSPRQKPGGAFRPGFVTLAAAVIVIVVVAVYAFRLSQQRTPIRIAFIGGVTGHSADLGVNGRNGAMLAVEERNAAGGINGHPVELVVRDDAQDPEVAKGAVREIIDQQVEAIVGPMTSSICMAIMPAVDEAQVVLLSPTVTTDILSGKDDYFFRVCSSVRLNAAKDAEFHYRVKGLRTAAAIYDAGNQAYTKSWLDCFQRTFESLGGKLLTSVSFEPPPQDGFKSLVQEALQAKPDTLLVITNVIDAVHICNQVRIVDPRIPIALSEWASTERLIELGGGIVEGVHVSQYVDRNCPLPAYQAFLKSFQARFGGEPGFPGVSAYDATHVVLDALQSRKPGETLKNTLLRIRSFPGLQETIEFDESGDSFRALHISVVENGGFRIVR